MSEVVLFGAAYSVYVRAARLALAEKGVGYRLREVDVFAAGGPPADYLERHPFGRIPAFEYDGFRLYETGAITRYVDDAFSGPPLMPDTPRARARANQIIGILDAYAYRTWVWDIYVERVSVPGEGGETDEARIAAALPAAETCLDAIEGLMEESTCFLTDRPTLADLHAAPMFDYFRRTPEGDAMLGRRPRWRVWWDRMGARPSMAATRPPRLD